MTNIGKSWKRHARQLKAETYALYLAYRDPRTPWYARVVAAVVVGYAFSPIDLIPDFIPILGYLDDLIITPLGLALALRLIPAEVMAEARAKAESGIKDGQFISRFGLVFVICAWLIGLSLVIYIVLRHITRK